MPMEGIKQVVIVSVAAAAPQRVDFPGTLEWVQFINNGAPNIFVLGYSEEILFKAWPGDVWPFRFESQDFNSLRIYGDVVNTAAEIAAGDVLYIRYKLKSRADREA